MANKEIVEKLREQALELRKNLIRLCSQERIHIGGDMSSADLMTVIWLYALKYDVKNPKWDARDRFVLSKGHASAVTSFAQAIRGCYDIDDVFNEYAKDNGRFGMHSCNLINPYVDVSTGSLGHGLPIAVGMAQALRMKKSDNRVYVVMGDGEADEGSVWEAAMYARHYNLGNLIVWLDRNSLQVSSLTEDVIALEPFADKWRAFGWDVIEADGHNISEMVDIVDSLPSPDSAVPRIVICRTTKGRNISFIENQVEWHLGIFNTDELCNKALDDVQTAFEGGK